MLKIALLFSAVVSVAFGQGFCFKPVPVKDFNREAFSGKWRVHNNVGRPLITGKIQPCLAYNFSGSQKYNIDISSVIGGKTYNSSAVEIASRGGTLVLNSPDSGRVLAVVLDTDYENFAIIFLCVLEGQGSTSGHSSVQAILRSNVRDDALIEKKFDEALDKVLFGPPGDIVDQKGCTN